MPSTPAGPTSATITRSEALAMVVRIAQQNSEYRPITDAESYALRAYVAAHADAPAVTGEPVAWGVVDPNTRKVLAVSVNDPHHFGNTREIIVPLFLHPAPAGPREENASTVNRPDISVPHTENLGGSGGIVTVNPASTVRAPKSVTLSNSATVTYNESIFSVWTTNDTLLVITTERRIIRDWCDCFADVDAVRSLREGA